MTRGEFDALVGALITTIVTAVLIPVLLAVASPFAERCPDQMFGPACASIEAGISSLPMLVGPLALIVLTLGILAGIASSGGR